MDQMTMRGKWDTGTIINLHLARMRSIYPYVGNDIPAEALKIYRIFLEKLYKENKCPQVSDLSI